MNPDLDELALQVNWRNLALGHPTLETEHATFVVDPAYPSIHDANFITNVTASTEDEIEGLLARARTEYAHCETLSLLIGPGASPALEARLGLIGTERHGTLVSLLEGELSGTPKAHDLRPVENEAAWRAIAAMKRIDWREYAPKLGEDPDRMEIPDGLSAANRSKCPPVRYVLAYVEDQAVGYFNSWEGMNGVGQVEDLFVLPEFRHRGIATALIHRCVAAARARGAGPIVICSNPADTPKTMYAAMGWRPIAMCRQYGVSNKTRKLEGDADDATRERTVRSEAEPLTF